MNIRRFFTSVIILSIFSGMFAQQSVDLDLKGSKNVRISLGGPAQTVPVNLLLNVTYQPEEEIIKIVLKGGESQDGSRISSTNKKTKDQITHLLFLLNWNGFYYHEINLKNYFKDPYQSKVELERPIKEQIVNTSSSDILRPAFEIANGEFENKNDKDIILPLTDGELVLKIKVSSLKSSVQLRINNVIPFRAEKEGALYSNKFFLKYISNSITVTFNIPEDKCAKQYDLIRKYESLNSEMSGEVKRLKEYVKYVSVDKDDINRIVQRQWPLIYKYEKIREEISALDTKCEKLFEQFADFNDYYNQIIGVNALTPDSIQNMIDSLDLFRQLLQTANDRISCKEWKDEAVRYIAGVEIDEEAFDQSSKVYELVVRFNKLKKYIEEFNCPVEVINTVTPIAPVAPVVEKPLETPKPATKKPKCKCSDASAKFETAANRIDDLIDKRRAKRVDNSSEFNSIVKQMDNYWNELDESCKTDKQCAAKYELYKKMKNSYNTYVK